MGAKPTTVADPLLQVLTERSLPVARRGYDREATDSLLGQLEEGLRATIQRHQETQSRLAELDRRIQAGQEREEAVTEALVVATQIKADSEREGEEIKARYLREAEAAAEDTTQRAAQIVKDAEAQAEAMLQDAKLKVKGFEQEIRDMEQLAADARSRLRAFLESLLEEIEHRGSEHGRAVDDLLTRASEAAKGELHSGRRSPVDTPS